jgi:hypothetical protein
MRFSGNTQRVTPSKKAEECSALLDVVVATPAPTSTKVQHLVLVVDQLALAEALAMVQLRRLVRVERIYYFQYGY